MSWVKMGPQGLSKSSSWPCTAQPLHTRYQRLDKPSDLICFSYDFPSRPFTTFVILLWLLSNNFISFLCPKLYTGLEIRLQRHRIKWGLSPLPTHHSRIPGRFCRTIILCTHTHTEAPWHLFWDYKECFYPHFLSIVLQIAFILTQLVRAVPYP